MFHGTFSKGANLHLETEHVHKLLICELLCPTLLGVSNCPLLSKALIPTMLPSQVWNVGVWSKCFKDTHVCQSSAYKMPNRYKIIKQAPLQMAGGMSTAGYRRGCRRTQCSSDLADCAEPLAEILSTTASCPMLYFPMDWSIWAQYCSDKAQCNLGVSVWWVGPGWISGAHKSRSINHSSSPTAQGREHITKGSSVKIKTGRDHTSYYHG